MTEYYLPERGIAYRANTLLPGRTTLVFIHGLSGSLSAWYPFEKLFSGYNVVTFDLRGHGRSVRPASYRAYALPEFAEDLHELLAHLRIERAVLISHSYGSLVALEYLHAHPEKVRALVLVSPGAFLDRDYRFGILYGIGRALLPLLRLLPFRRSTRGRNDYSKFSFTSDWDLRRIIPDISLTTVHSYLYSLLQARAKRYDRLWGSVRVPTLIVHGSQDGIVPYKHAEALAGTIRDATLVTLPGAEHITVINNIPEVSAAIRSFLRTSVERPLAPEAE